ncbi:TolC family protein [Sphingobacterium siyangense]|uniref:TolC family protein n=1 Tax=Sphingobacterium siyangense TaxID=459529 RepID=UPI0035E3F3F8
MNIRVKLYRSQLYPTISYGSTFGTMFYNSFVFKSLPAGNQLKNNLYQQVFFRISVPIYNRSVVKNSLSQNAVLRKQLLNNLSGERLQRNNQLKNYIINWRSNYKMYNSNASICIAMKGALNDAEINFKNGKINYSELHDVRARYLSSEREKIRSMYNCYFHKFLVNNLISNL